MDSNQFRRDQTTFYYIKKAKYCFIEERLCYTDFQEIMNILLSFFQAPCSKGKSTNFCLQKVFFSGFTLQSDFLAFLFEVKQIQKSMFLRSNSVQFIAIGDLVDIKKRKCRSTLEPKSNWNCTYLTYIIGMFKIMKKLLGAEIETLYYRHTVQNKQIVK